MRGRPRKPTARHELEGTTNPSRINAAEPRYSVAIPEKPPAVEARRLASAEWDRICPIMLEQRTLSPAFRVAVEMYVLCYADVQDAERGVKKARGTMEKAQASRTLRDARKELRQWAVECGLTQASAGKVSSAPPGKEESPLAQLEAKRAKLIRIK